MLMHTIYDFDDEYDEDIINVKKLLGALSRNVTRDNVPALAEILGLESSLLSRALCSIDHIDVIKW